MEKAIITETRGGNPKYIIKNSKAEIRVELRKKDNTAQIHLKHNEINASEIYGREIEIGNNEIYLKSLQKVAYPDFCFALINYVYDFYENGMSIQEIATKIYKTYQNNENVKQEVISLQEKFKKLNNEFKEHLTALDELSKEMDYMCKQMEML